MKKILFTLAFAILFTGSITYAVTILSTASTDTISVFRTNTNTNVTNLNNALIATTSTNTWTVLQTFSGAASTSQLSVQGGTAWFGGTATSSFSSAGALTLITPLLVGSGGTGASTLTGCLTGNGTGAITGSGTCNTSAASVTSVGLSSSGTLTIGSTPVTTSGTITADLNLASANTWTALQQFSNSTSTLLSAGKLFITGAGTSTIANNLNITGNLQVDGSFFSPVSIVSSGNATINGTLTVTGATTLATSLTGLIKGASGVISSITTSAGIAGEISDETGTGVLVFGTIPTLTGFLSTASSTVSGLLTATNASTTNLWAGTSFYSPVTSALLLGDANKLVGAASTQTCTNQFLRVMSGAYAGTCATVGAADVSLANLTATDGTLTFSGTYTGATARTIGLNLGNANTWTALQTINNASSTNATFATFLTIPSSASQTTTLAGQIAVDTTNGQLKYDNGNISDPRRFLTFPFATSTTWTGTTTSAEIPIPTAMTFNSIQCKTDAGTANVQVSYGQPATNLAMLNASTTMGTFTWTTNNTPPAATTTTVAFGTPASSPTKLGCTISATVTGT